MNHLSYGASAGVVVLGLGLWAMGAWLCWANWRRGAPKRGSGKLELLRFLLITLLVLTLLRPEYVQRLRRTGTPEIAVLVDQSGSMQTRDLVQDGHSLSREQWVADALKAGLTAPLGRGARVEVQPFSAASTNTNSINGTDINEALQEATHRFKNLRAVLLLTDGEWNLGKSPLAAATVLREGDVPVFSVAVGRETPLPGLSLERVAAPAYGLLGEEMAIPFKIISHLPQEVRTEVSIVDANGEIASKSIVIPAEGELEDSILWLPPTAGEVTATLKLPVQPGEVVAENHTQTFHVAIRAEKIKVLVIDSLPRWEYRYLRNALARDPGVELSCLLLQPDLGAGEGRDYIPAFPASKEALAPYDVVFVGDIGIGPGELTDTDARLLAGLVEQQGSGLVFVPGRRGREETFSHSPLQDLFPVDLDAAKPYGIGLQNESQLLLTDMGRRHWLTRFDAAEDRNDELWKQLPGFFWSAAVAKSRPGSEVLAVHSAMRNAWGRMPLLVTRTAGNGKVLFLGSDSAWRWRRGVEDKFHYRFWGQVVRWMAHQRHLSGQNGIRLAYSPETPQAGDTVFLQSTVLDQAGFPIDKGPVEGVITGPDGRVERLDFSQVEGGWGVFKSSFKAAQAGAYRMRIDAKTYGRTLSTTLAVAQPALEKIGEPVNSDILRQVSALTRGLSGSVEEAKKIVSQISLLPAPQPLERRVRWWSDPIWGGCLLLLLIVYWVGRKLAGMI